MKFKVTIELEYNISNESLEEWYGTTDPKECAQIIKKTFESLDVLTELLGSGIGDFSVDVES